LIDNKVTKARKIGQKIIRRAWIQKKWLSYKKNFEKRRNSFILEEILSWKNP
jgi:hypothetical protein